MKSVKLILDNCDSLGSKWDGKYLGDYAVAFSNSFYPAHHISTGEGGMICTNDEEIKKIRFKDGQLLREYSCPTI